MTYRYFSDVVLDWALKHPEMKEDFKLAYEYWATCQAFHIRMEYVPYKHGVCELLDEDIMDKLVCPHDHIFAVLDNMYKTLKEDEEKEREKLRDFIRSWLIINADRHDDNIEVRVKPGMAGNVVGLVKDCGEKSIYAGEWIPWNNDGTWGAFTADLYKKLKEKEKKEMPPKFTFTEEIKSVTFTPIDNDERLKMAKAAVVCWYNMHNGPESIKLEDVYIVWFCKTLQNWKVLAGTHHGDGMYYEITFDGDKECAYVDAYKKWQNVSMTADLLMKVIKDD